VAALAVVNAFGGAYDPQSPPPSAAATTPFAGGSTTLAVVATNARLSKLDCLRVSQAGHSGIARALEPAHTAFDGDAVLTAATGTEQAEPEQVRMLAARAVEAAVRSEL